MPCFNQPVTPALRDQRREALKRLQAAIGAGTVSLVVSSAGAIALRGWRDADRAGLSDVCAYRELRNTRIRPTGRRDRRHATPAMRSRRHC